MAEEAPGLIWAAHLRSVRESTLEQMARGDADLAGVLSVRDDPAVGAMRLLCVLEAVPGALKVLTRRRLAELGWEETRPISDLSRTEVDAVVREFAVPVSREVRDQ